MAFFHLYATMCFTVKNVLGCRAVQLGQMEGYDVRQRGIYRDLSREDHSPRADALLDYLENKSDFFTAPASARYHGAYAGGCVTTA